MVKAKKNDITVPKEGKEKKPQNRKPHGRVAGSGQLPDIKPRVSVYRFCLILTLQSMVRSRVDQVIIMIISLGLGL